MYIKDYINIALTFRIILLLTYGNNSYAVIRSCKYRFNTKILPWFLFYMATQKETEKNG